jgi:Holliday junction resolvase-like predicted endonuclease
MAFARKTDTHHAAIRQVLRQCGYEVLDTSHARDFVDLVAWKAGTVAHIEIKTKLSKRGRVRKTASQQTLEDRGFPIVYLTSADDALAWVRAQGERS